MSERPYPVCGPLPCGSTRPVRPLILIVEPHEDSRDLLKTLLELSGYEVALALDGDQVWEQVKQLSLALILIDTHLPGTDTLRLLSRLRRHWRLASVPIIATSCNAAPAFRRAALAAGCDELLVKPIDFDYLTRMLKHHLASL